MTHLVRSNVRRSACPAVVMSAAIALTLGTASIVTTTSQAQEEAAAYAFQAASSPITDAIPSEIQQRVEDTAAAYNAAVAAREELEVQIQENQDAIAELESKMPELQDRAAEAIRTTYRYQQGSDAFIDIILSSESFSSLVSIIQYLDSVQAYNTEQIDALATAQQELVARQEQLGADLAAAQEQEQIAAAALEEAKAARVAAQEQARLEAQRAREAAARAAAEEEARRAQEAAAYAEYSDESYEPSDAYEPSHGDEQSGDAANEGDTSEQTQDVGTGTDDQIGETGQETIETPQPEPEPEPEPDPVVYYEEPEPEPVYEDTSSDVDWMSDRDIFVNEWGARIDAYLSGTPMAGHGYTFAAAAWDYGIDPRWSPAISCVESGCGTYCFRPYNAWGWGSASWSNWDEAIYGHVSGLAAGYGPTFEYEDAVMYCPPTADEWYSQVLGQMSCI